MKKVLFIFLCSFLTLLTIVSPFLLIPNKNQNEKLQKPSLSVWHIDGFEGGIGSRLTLLNGVASEYMKKQKVIINVSYQTFFSAQENFNKGIFPDIISYSNGLNLPYERILSLPFEKEFEYAIPWCTGGYLLINHKGNDYGDLIISTQEYTIPMLAVELSGIKKPIKCMISSEKAVYEFYASKNSAIVCTQRDLFRLENKGVEIDVKPLLGYNDLYQYVSILSERENYQLALSFLTYFLSECDNFPLLKKIGMLPRAGYSDELCNANLKVYENCQFEYATYPLISKERVEFLQKQASNFQNQEESIKNGLKRLKLSDN